MGTFRLADNRHSAGARGMAISRCTTALAGAEATRRSNDSVHDSTESPSDSDFVLRSGSWCDLYLWKCVHGASRGGTPGVLDQLSRRRRVVPDSRPVLPRADPVRFHSSEITPAKAAFAHPVVATSSSDLG